VDLTLELWGGLLGSYFGAMVAALVTAMKSSAPEQMEQSVRSGFGLGFAFWALSISLVNRVLIQGVSRASIGKKLFKLELIASGEPITWTTMLKRWVVSVGSVAAGGFGYWYAFFNEERKTLHDLIAGTDVVPMFQSPSVSMEYSEQTRSFEEIRQILVPEAVVPAVVAEVVAEVVSEKATLADVISIQEWKKGDAENQSENQDEKKRAA
jgi:uncharacterized RDD family membrane protein YckC